MKGAFDHLTRCGDMTTEDMEAACASSEAFGSLLAHLQEVSAPNTGCASLLIALGQLASTACDWVDGDLAIELLDVDDCTEVRIMTELGAGMRERLFPPLRFRMPLVELTAALTAEPTIVGALKVNRRSWKRVTLEANAQTRRSTRPPRISEASLVAVRVPIARGLAKPSPRSEETELDDGWDVPDEIAPR